jgi:hypothetical protein
MLSPARVESVMRAAERTKDGCARPFLFAHHAFIHAALLPALLSLAAVGSLRRPRASASAAARPARAAGT